MRNTHSRQADQGRVHQHITAPTWALSFALTMGSIFATSPAQAQQAPAALKTVPFVDVARYQGVWYQAALIPNRFQKQCISHTQATYKPMANGNIEVTNTCKNASGAMERVVGEARPARKYGAKVDAGQLNPPMLQVRFAPAWLAALPYFGEKVWGDYWVIQLADDYRYAVVGDPTREFLWLLSRTPKLLTNDRADIHTRLLEQGYNPSRLKDELH